jgi:septal ring factor EnvC (AmiA/AmiB activator)
MIIASGTSPRPAASAPPAPSTPPRSAPAAPQPVDLDAEIKRLEGEIQGLEQRLESAGSQRDRCNRQRDDCMRRCNELYDRLQPLFNREEKLCKMMRIARYAGLGSGMILASSMSLAVNAPMVGLPMLAIDALVLGGAVLATEHGKKSLRSIRPEINSLVSDWKGSKSSLDSAEADANRCRAEVSTLTRSLRELQGKAETCRVARGVFPTAPPAKTVTVEAEVVTIGSLKVPRRSKAGEEAAARDRR